MTTNTKILLGILSIVPIICLFIYFWSFFSFFTDTIDLAGHKSHNPQGEAAMFFDNMKNLFITLLVLCASSLALLIYFIIHAVNNQHISSDERLVWILVFIFVGIIGFPVYWVLRIWQTPQVKQEATIQTA